MCLLALVGLYVLAPSASAASTSTYPHSLDVAILGPNSALDAPVARMIVTGSSPASIYTVRVLGACQSDTAGTPGMKALYDGVTKSSNNPADCDGPTGDDFVFTNVNANRTLRMEKINGQGHESFRVQADGPGVVVSHLENPNRFTPGYGPVGNTDGDNYGFSSWIGNGSVFEFTAPCDHVESQIVYLKWKDVDEGEFNQGTGAYIVLRTYDSSGVELASSPQIKNNLGGQNATGYLPLIVKAGYEYSLEWRGISGGNAIQQVLPFTNNPGLICTPPPTPPPSTFNATCDTISFGIPADSSLEEASVDGLADATVNDRYRVWVNDLVSPGIDPAIDAPDFGNTAAEGSTVTYDLVATGKIHPGVLSFHIEIHRNSNLSSPVIKVIDYSTPGNCYTATCTAYTVIPNFSGAPLDSVLAGSQFFIIFNITNTGINDLPAGLPPNQPLSGEIGGGSDPQFGGAQPLGQGIPVNGTVPGIMAQNASNDRSVRFLRLVPTYNGMWTLGPGCDFNISTYQHFNLSATANGANATDPENPEHIDYSNSITMNEGPSDLSGVPASFNSRLYYLPYGSASPLPNDFDGVAGTDRFVPNGNPNPHTFNGTWDDPFAPPGTRDFIHGGTPGVWQPGDQYCATIHVSPADGYLGPGDAVAPGAVDADSPPACGTVVNRPFTRSYMGDVSAGGQFENSPAPAGAGVIKTYTKTYTLIGSGVEFAAEAMSVITNNGFSSAFLRTALPTQPYGLSFANNPNAPCTLTIPGCFRGSRVVYDYFGNDMTPATKLTAPISTSSLNLHTRNNNPQDDEKQTWINTGGAKLDLRFPGVPGVGARYNISHEIFVEGDVFIGDDIIYNNGPWNNISDIPNFRLVVHGNIYISRDVGQLDGTYIAEPKADGTGGIIYTCVDPSTKDTFAAASLFDGCKVKKLQVNGAFIAQDISFLRTIYSLSDVPGAAERFVNDHAAESFRLSPEYFLGLPAANPIGGTNNGQYQDIKTLPPLL
jgi:hypothetical protein